jgi:hypothetical protein
MDSTWFTAREIDLIQVVVNTISDEMNLEAEELMHSINLPYSHPLDRILNKHFKYDICKCRVKVKEGGQCTRQVQKNKTMCATHEKMHSKGSLSKEMLIRIEIDDAIERFRKIRSESRFNRLQLYVLDDTDYLYDPLTSNLYDFDSIERIGKMHSSGKVFFKRAEEDKNLRI